MNYLITVKTMDQKIKIGTVGLGLMGCSIATCILAAGHQVTSLVKKIETVDEARERIKEFLLQLNAEGILKEDVQEIIARHTITDDVALLKDHEVVIETIIENVAEKKQLYQQLETVLSATAIMFSTICFCFSPVCA